jgi:hypothetical protein
VVDSARHADKRDKNESIEVQPLAQGITQANRKHQPVVLQVALERSPAVLAPLVIFCSPLFIEDATLGSLTDDCVAEWALLQARLVKSRQTVV